MAWVSQRAPAQPAPRPPLRRGPSAPPGSLERSAKGRGSSPCRGHADTQATPGRKSLPRPPPPTSAEKETLSAPSRLHPGSGPETRTQQTLETRLPDSDRPVGRRRDWPETRWPGGLARCPAPARGPRPVLLLPAAPRRSPRAPIQMATERGVLGPRLPHRRLVMGPRAGDARSRPVHSRAHGCEQ